MSASARPIASHAEQYRRWADQERERAAEYARTGRHWQARDAERLALEYERLEGRVDLYVARFVAGGAS